MSALAASAVAGSQVIAAMPINAVAAEADNQIRLAQDVSTGTVSASEVKYGDVDGSGAIDSVDARIIERYITTGDDTSIDLAAADVDEDGKVTLRDAEIVLNYFAASVTGNAGKFDLPYSGDVEWNYYPDPANYEIINKGMTWQEAEAYCESKGGHLAVITSAYEQAQIEALISAQSEIKNNYWIGFKRNDDGEFDWVTGEKADYTHWNPNTPNNSNGNQNTAYIYGNEFKSFGGQIGKWDDINESAESSGDTFFGTENFGFILEIDGKTVNSAAGPAAGEAYDTEGLDLSAATVKPTLSLNTISVPVSEAIKNPVQKIELKVSGADEKYSSTGVIIKFDPRLTLVKNGTEGFEFGDVCKGMSREVTRIDGSSYYISTMSNKNSGKDGTLVSFEVSIPSDARLDDVFPIEIAYSDDNGSKCMFRNFDNNDEGIDISDDDNFNSFQYTIEADFDTAGVVIDKIVSFDTSGAPVRNHVVINVAGNTGVVISANKPTYVPGLGAYVVRTETVEEEMYMIIYGKSKWLKEFYDVKLIVVNNDTKALKDCTATLNIPDGLTLCKGDQTQDFGDLNPNEVKTADWYLRGDKEGDYDLTAVFSGLNGGEQFDYTFKSKDTLHVYSASALKMIVELPRYSYYNDFYTMKIKLENVSDKPIYDLENVITRLEQGSDATLYRSYGNGELKQVADKHMDIFSKNDVARISVDELAPGESAVIELKVKDLWKSVYEQYIGSDIRNAHLYNTLLAASRRPELFGYYWFNRLYEEALGELPVEHILKSVTVNFAGSDMTVPYEVNIIENGTESTGGLHIVSTNSAFTTLRQAFFKDKTDPRATYTYYRNNYILAPFCMVYSPDHSSRYAATGYGDFLDNALGRSSGHAFLIRPVSLFTINTTSPEVTATVYPVSFGMIASIAVLMTAAGAAMVIRNKREDE